MTDTAAPSTVAFVIRCEELSSGLTRSLESIFKQSLRGVHLHILAPDTVRRALEDIAIANGAQIFHYGDDILFDSCLPALPELVCFVEPGAVYKPGFAEKCGWFLQTRPYLSLCSAQTVLSQELAQILGPDLTDSATFLAQLTPERASALMLRRADIARAYDTGWQPWRDGVAGLLVDIAKAGGWGMTLPEVLVEIPPHSGPSLANPAPVVDLPNSITTPVAPDRGAYATLATDPVLDVPAPMGKSGKLRICMVLSWMTTGGADKFNLDLLEMLRARGHEVTVCTTLPSDHPWESRFAALTDDIFVTDRFLDPADVPRFLSYLIKSRDMDCVLISGSTLGYQLTPFLCAMVPDVTYMDLCHVEEPHWNSGGHPRFAIGYSDVFDFNIVSTRHLADWMQAHGADGDHIKVLYTGVEEHAEQDVAAVRAQVRARLELADDLPLVIFGGRICPQKRPLLLAQILHMAQTSGLEFRAAIVGNGELRGAFEAALAQHGLSDRVTLYGALDHAQWFELLQGADAFLLPSEYEGISIALLEAMSLGVVPIVSDVGGQGEIITEASGYLIPHSSDEAQHYVDALRAVFLNPQERRARGKAARDVIAQSFSKSSTIAAFESYVVEAKTQAKVAPRMHIPRHFGIESATTALELNRISSAFSWMASNSQKSEDQAELIALVNMLLKLRRSRPGQMLTNNRLARGAIRRTLRLFNRS